jgi:hypothetical protein
LRCCFTNLELLQKEKEKKEREKDALEQKE